MVRALFDRTAWELLGSNLLTLVVALWQQWPLALLMFPYLLQSIVIGVFAWRRIRVVPDYRVGSFTIRINGQVMTPETWPPRRLAGFFAVHFGGFHVFYLLFLFGMAFAGTESATALDWLGSLALTLPFVASQRAVHRQQVAADRGKPPGTGSLMLRPYLRIVPMHVGILGGFALVSSASAAWGLVLFCGLKTLFDLIAHLADRALLLAAQVDEKDLEGLPELRPDNIAAFRDAVIAREAAKDVEQRPG